MVSDNTTNQDTGREEKRDTTFWFLAALKGVVAAAFAAIYFLIPAISYYTQENSYSNGSEFFLRADGTWFLFSFLLVLPVVVSVASPFVDKFRKGLLKRFRPWIFWVALAGNMVYLNWFIPPLPSEIANPYFEDMLQVQHISFALAKYSETHDGKLPPTLDDLVGAGLVELAKPILSPAMSENAGRLPYIYFSELTSDMPAGCIILASQVHIVLRHDKPQTCWYIRNGFYVPVSSRVGSGWRKSYEEIMGGGKRRIKGLFAAQLEGMNIAKSNLDDPARLGAALSALKNRSRHRITRCIVAWALGAHKVEAARPALYDIFRKSNFLPGLKFECARALLRIGGNESDYRAAAKWIASNKLASGISPPPLGKDIPAIVSAALNLGRGEIDEKKFAASTGLSPDTARDLSLIHI